MAAVAAESALDAVIHGGGPWSSAACGLTVRDLVLLAPASRGARAAAGKAVGSLRVALLADSCPDYSCPPWDWEEEAEGPLQLCGLEDFLEQPCGPCVDADVLFAAEAAGELFGGRGAERLVQAVRRSLPACLGPDVPVCIDAIRDVEVSNACALGLLRAVRPRVLGASGLAASTLTDWARIMCGLPGIQTLVVSNADGVLLREGCLQRLLGALPGGIRGLDIHYLDARLQAFPVYMLPAGCVAFGTVALHCSVDRPDKVLVLDEFLCGFPAFPAQVSIVRLALGVERRWRHTGQEIARALGAKFPGLAAAQLELSLHSSSARKGVDVSDAPFIDLVSCLVAAGVRVGVTTIACRDNQFEFFRVALEQAGAAVHGMEELLPVRPFSHPKYEWQDAVGANAAAAPPVAGSAG